MTAMVIIVMSETTDKLDSEYAKGHVIINNMSFSSFETIIQNAKLWKKTSYGFEVSHTNSSGEDTAVALSRNELSVDGDKLVNALDILSANYSDVEVAKYLRCIEISHRLLPTQLFDENNPTHGRTWSKWTYFKISPHSHKQDLTLMYEMHDGIITYPLTMPEPVWRLCYPGLMNRYDAAQAMGMSATETANFCTPKKPLETAVVWPDNIGP